MHWKDKQCRQGQDFELIGERVLVHKQIQITEASSFEGLQRNIFLRYAFISIKQFLAFMIITRSKKLKVENCLFLGKSTVNIEIIKAAKVCEGHLYSPLAHRDYTSINAGYLSTVFFV